MYSCAVRCRVAACRCCLYCCLKTMDDTRARTTARPTLTTVSVSKFQSRARSLLSLSSRRALSPRSALLQGALELMDAATQQVGRGRAASSCAMALALMPR